QSIYSFRQADVSIFQEQLKSIQRQQTDGVQFIDDLTNQILFSNEKERKGVIELPDNFRSTWSLIHFFNFLFEKVLAQETELDVEFNPLAFPG
ncbi:MAG: hypothetical protein GWN16_00150, partial [Calditrichae bacterium]|nr:hypothetical protein [Calditrichia bacterium]